MKVGTHPDLELAAFTGSGYNKGRGVVIQALWMLVSSTIFMRWWCPSGFRVRILRLFGATVGSDVLIRHRVRIHWPWKLSIGSNAWIGEGAWLLNLEPISIGSNACISQEVLLCTGSHSRRSRTFEFDNGPIVIGNRTWIAARATILRGVVVGDNAVVGATALVTSDIGNGAIVTAPSGASRIGAV